MKRHLLIAAIFLLAGAVVNVAVAWCVCAVTDHKVAYTIPLDDVPTWMEGTVDLKVGGRPFGTDYEEHRPSFGADRRLYRVTWTTSQSTRMIDAGYALLGWPMRCCAGGWYYDRSTNDRQLVDAVRLPIWAKAWNEYFLPVGPIWPGFAVNTLFYATILWLLIPGPFALRRAIRIRCGHCPRCAYPMGESAICTECGKPLPRRVQVTA